MSSVEVSGAVAGAHLSAYTDSLIVSGALQSRQWESNGQRAGQMPKKD